MSTILVEFEHNYRKIHIEKSKSTISIVYFKKMSNCWIVFDKLRVRDNTFMVNTIIEGTLIDILIKSELFEYIRDNNKYIFKFINSTMLYLI